jgi:uncharacterized SAM-binding protein YcdF (DUF218 family)
MFNDGSNVIDTSFCDRAIKRLGVITTPQKSRRCARSGMLLVLLLLTMVARRYWLPLVGGLLIVEDPLQRADAIVPLAGDPSRVGGSIKLFQSGYADWFVVTDMWIDTSTPPLEYAHLVTTQAIADGVPRSRILLAPGTPRTTRMELIDIRRLAEDRRLTSLLVVTSPSHTRRARLIVHDVFLHTGIKVMVRPVTSHWYTADSWWTTQAGRHETYLEYLKLLAYLIGID